MNIWSMMGLSKGLRKGAWSAKEDSLLRQCIDKYGEGKWHQVPLRAGLNRCRKSCRLRWLSYLKPDINKGKFSSDEVDLLIRLHKLLGNRWSLIAGRLPGRTANGVKNYWNTHLSKKYGSFDRTKLKNKNITSIPPPTKEVHRTEVLKPRPRSFSAQDGCSHLNGLPQVNDNPSCFGLNTNNACGITCDIDKEKDEFVNNLTNEDNMWLESLLEESQEIDVVGSEITTTNKESTLTFDVEHLWRLFDEDTVQLN